MTRDKPDEALGNIQIHWLPMFESLPVNDVLFAVDDNADKLRDWAGPEDLAWLDEWIEALRTMAKGIAVKPAAGEAWR